jgi:lon-related putative ATP-dependent protease
MENVKSLSVEQLYQTCDPAQFDFETTDEIDDMDLVIGQPRAIEAIEFGIGIDQEGFNLFAQGPVGIGKEAVMRQFFERKAKQEPVPPDVCYVNNFEQQHKPSALLLPAGRGKAFAEDMGELVHELQTALRGAFESEEYQTRRQTLEEEAQEQQQESLEELQEKAREQGVALVRTPVGLVFAPIKDGEVLPPEEMQQLSEEERQELQKKVEQLQEELQRILQNAPRQQRELRDRIRQLNKEVAEFAVGGLIDELKETYSDLPKVVDHLDEVRQDVIENVEDFLPEGEQEQAFQQAMAARAGMQPEALREAAMRRYRVNLLVDNSETEGAPVVYENNPTYQNLVGRVEHRAQMGALLTDFSLIKPGALHKANGGYLILDARKVLLQPYAWEGLKRALRAGEIRIESLGQMYSAISTVSLEPEPIDLDVKVALMGDRELYYLLYYRDPEFQELFKVNADFDEQMDRDTESEKVYAKMIATLAKHAGVRPLDRTGVARVIEHSSRIAADTKKLTTHRQSITDLLSEANYWAGKDGNGAITAQDVQKAIDAQIYRSDRLRERVQEAILRDTFYISTEGAHVGQVNGLSVMQLGGFAFGRPSRITSRISLGKGDVVDIEREVELGGPIHSKGVLILAGFLRERYGGDKPLSLSATLVFEQSYGGVDGDSASSAELYTLLSGIAEIPIKQSLAVTGSMNQHGEVQPIGGANEKIEGFFDICRQRGLTGEQGVLIPASNVKHLMLRQDVRDAVVAGKFHIYPVRTVDEGIEILTGTPAGESDSEGNYPEGTVNHMVNHRLQQMTEKRLELQAREEAKE